MSTLNIEVKARCSNPSLVRDVLKSHGADFKGLDHQIDTYFLCSTGRLKLREGSIEHALIHYQREDRTGPKKAFVHLYHPHPGPELKNLLTAALGVKCIVDKKREVYFIDNVKFHIDVVKTLGDFVEIEAIDRNGSIDESILLSQCRKYIHLFEIAPDDHLPCSYSDLVASDVY